MNKFTKTLLAIGALILASLACNQPVSTPPPAPQVPALADSSPAEVVVSPTPAEIPDFVRGDWQGTVLSDRELRERMQKVGYDGLIDFVSEDVPEYGVVSRIIFGGDQATQPDALRIAAAAAQEFNGVLWYRVGTPGSGNECGFRTQPESGVYILDISIYSTGQFLPQETSCRQSPG